MARIYQVLQRGSDKRWDMTVSSDEEGWVHPVGYCAGWFDWDDEKYIQRHGVDFVERAKEEQNRLLPFKGSYHRDGHATSEEAEACWKRFELDVELKFVDSSSEQKKCQICDVWTTRYAEVGQFHRRFVLCPEHATRDQVEILMEKH
jgi:hypothetical protein